MIPNVEKSVSVQSNITGETGQFSVDESALTHIMDVLTNLYTDPEQAVVREYLTNAYDAQVDAGMKPGTSSWKPIKVTTPSAFVKSYTIRDYGVGMDSTDLAEIYSKYGKSTKTTSNDVVGMLGLGSKCALTYTNSFTIIGYKGGVKTTAIVSKNEDNIPVFLIVDTAATDEPDGVEISVPVRDRNSFAEKTKKFLRFWQAGLVEVDGEAPESHGFDSLGEADFTYTRSGENFDAKAEVFVTRGDGGYYSTPTSYVVMGNVAYPIDFTQVHDGPRGTRAGDLGVGFVAYVPIGSVNFPPSRETLYYNDNVKSVIKQIESFVVREVVQFLKGKIASASTYKEAWVEWAAVGYNIINHASMKNLCWNGLLIESYLSLSTSINEVYWDYNDRCKVVARRQLDLSRYLKGNHTLVVLGKPEDKNLTAGFKRKLRHYIEEVRTDTLSQVLIFETSFVPDQRLKDLPTVAFDNINTIKLKRAASTQKSTPSFDVIVTKNATGNVSNDYAAPATSVTAKNVYYVSPTALRETRYKRSVSTDSIMKYLPNDSNLVVLAANRFEKFQRDFPKAVTLESFWRSEVKRQIAAVPEEYKIVRSLGYNEKRFCTHADHSKILDPELKKLVKFAKESKDTTSDSFSIAERMSHLARNMDFSGCHASLDDPADLDVFQKYPLLSECSDHIDHLVFYVNAMYEHNNRK